MVSTWLRSAIQAHMDASWERCSEKAVFAVTLLDTQTEVMCFEDGGWLVRNEGHLGCSTVGSVVLHHRTQDWQLERIVDLEALIAELRRYPVLEHDLKRAGVI